VLFLLVNLLLLRCLQFTKINKKLSAINIHKIRSGHPNLRKTRFRNFRNFFETRKLTPPLQQPAINTSESVLLNCAVFTQQTNIGYKLLQLVN